MKIDPDLVKLACGLIGAVVGAGGMYAYFYFHFVPLFCCACP